MHARGWVQGCRGWTLSSAVARRKEIRRGLAAADVRDTARMIALVARLPATVLVGSTTRREARTWKGCTSLSASSRDAELFREPPAPESPLWRPREMPVSTPKASSSAAARPSAHARMEKRARTFLPLGLAERPGRRARERTVTRSEVDGARVGLQPVGEQLRPRTVLKGQGRELDLLQRPKFRGWLHLIAAVGGEAIGGAVRRPRGGVGRTRLAPRPPVHLLLAAALLLALMEKRRHRGAEESAVGHAVKEPVHCAGIDRVQFGVAAQCLLVESVEYESIEEVQSGSGGLRAGGFVAPRMRSDSGSRDLEIGAKHVSADCRTHGPSPRRAPSRAGG